MKVRKGREVVSRPKNFRDEHHTSITKPENSEILVFEKHVKKLASTRSDPRILIMGASPELRNLASKNKIRTTVVANDLEVIERTSKLMERKNEKEEWLQGNIVKLPLKKNMFDVIFSDNIVSNVPPYNSVIFYRRMKEILKSKGFAVMRSVVFRKTERSFENRLSKHFRIVEKEYGKQGIFAEHFPIYHIVPKR